MATAQLPVITTGMPAPDATAGADLVGPPAGQPTSDN